MILKPSSPPERSPRYSRARDRPDRRLRGGNHSRLNRKPVIIGHSFGGLLTMILAGRGLAHRDAVAGERPQFLDKPIVQFFGPLAREKSNDFVSSVDELGAIPPSRIDRLSQGYLPWVANVPAVFSKAHFLNCTFEGEGRQSGRVVTAVVATISFPNQSVSSRSTSAPALVDAPGA